MQSISWPCCGSAGSSNTVIKRKVDETILRISHWEQLNLAFSSEGFMTADNRVVTCEVRTIEDVITETKGEQDYIDDHESGSATQVSMSVVALQSTALHCTRVYAETALEQTPRDL